MLPLAERRFVILAAPRSGSNMLCSMLDSHPDILCHHELFNPAGIFYALPMRESDQQTEQEMRQRMQARDHDPLGFLAQHAWQRHAEKSVVGFKMTYQQNLAVFQAVLRAPEIQKIVLQRNNGVKSYVSKLVAEQSGVWEDYGQARAHEHLQLELNLAHLQQDLAFNRRYYAEIDTYLRDTQQEYLQVQYEALMDSACQRKILDFLACSYQPLQTRSRKQNPSDLRQRVKNYGQILAQCQDPEILAQLTDLYS